MRTTTLREIISRLTDEEIISRAMSMDAQLTREECAGIIDTVRTVKPTYAYPDLRTSVSVVNGRIAASNLFFGSLSDIAVRKTDIPDDISFGDCEIAAAIVMTLANNMSNFEDQNEFFWTDMKNPQKAKIIR